MTCIAPGVGRAPCPLPREPGSLFCRGHEQAPAAQRGGWISAEKRRRKLAASADQALDASNVSPRLWIGGRPPADRELPDFDVLALCAAEHQPELLAFRGRVLRCPLGDEDTPGGLRRALVTANAIAAALTDGKRVLVTCHAGMNRAALVASLALARVTRMSAEDLVLLMRSRRHPGALSNPYFLKVLQQIVADGRRYHRR